MKLGLTSKVALVAGSSRGLGREIALALAREGAKLVICGRHGKDVKKTLIDMKKVSPHALGVIADLSRESDVKRLVNQVARKFGKIDILVNNVGGVKKVLDFGGLKERDWEENYRLNVVVPLRLIRCFLPSLKKSSSPRIINISSLSGVMPGYFNPHYAASKAALMNLGKSLSNYLAKDRILVNTVCPGPIMGDSLNDNLTEIVEQRGGSGKNRRSKILADEVQKIPLQRMGLPSDVASVVLFLASEKAPWITGACFHVNGGKLKTIF